MSHMQIRELQRLSHIGIRHKTAHGLSRMPSVHQIYWSWWGRASAETLRGGFALAANVHVPIRPASRFRNRWDGWDGFSSRSNLFRRPSAVRDYSIPMLCTLDHFPYTRLRRLPVGP